MSEEKSPHVELKDVLHKLRDELPHAELEDHDLRDELSALHDEIEKVLEAETPHQDWEFGQRVDRVMRQWGARHPKAAAALGRVADWLSSMGI